MALIQGHKAFVASPRTASHPRPSWPHPQASKVSQTQVCLVSMAPKEGPGLASQASKALNHTTKTHTVKSPHSQYEGTLYTAQHLFWLLNECVCVHAIVLPCISFCNLFNIHHIVNITDSHQANIKLLFTKC